MGAFAVIPSHPARQNFPWYTMRWHPTMFEHILVLFMLFKYAEGVKIASESGWDDFTVANSFTPPTAPISESWKDPTSKIYVSVSSFRDYRCPYTLNNLFSKAEFPERLHVGLINQKRQETKDKDCLQEYCRIAGGGCKFKAQIYNMDISAIDAKGPSFSRYLHTLMVSDEEFFLQIDSHMDFAKKWDTLLMRQWGLTNNEYAVITAYPADLAHLQTAALTPGTYTEVPYLCDARFTDAGMVKYTKAVALIDANEPVLQPLWSSMFSFSRTHAMRTVPPDPNLLMAYDGVEFATAARLWTRGYDFYAPSLIIATHDYNLAMALSERKRNDAASGHDRVDGIGWTENGMSPWHKRKMYADAMLRLRTLLASPGGEHTPSAIASLTKYGLGSARTLQEFINFSGVDTMKLLIKESTCRGGLHYVQPRASYDVWGDAEEIRPGGGANIPLAEGAVPRLDMSGLWHHMRALKSENGEIAGELELLEEERQVAELGQIVSEQMPVVGSVADAMRTLLGGSERALRLVLLLAPVLVIAIAAICIIVGRVETGSIGVDSGGWDDDDDGAVLPRTNPKAKIRPPARRSRKQSSD